MPAIRQHITAQRIGAAALVIIIAAVFAWSAQQRSPSAAPAANSLLIDDFSLGAKGSLLGNKWTLVNTPAARGPKGKIEFLKYDQRDCLHLSNAGEARLDLGRTARPLDARTFEGIEVQVRSSGGPYAIRLKTTDTRLAQQYYEARFEPDGTWQDIKLPFRQFAPIGLAKPLDLTGLRAVGIATLDGTSSADIYVAKVAFYSERPMYNQLTPEEERIIVGKGTEAPFSGKYNNFFENGVYTCKRCGAKLFTSSSKFKSDCGWPSFDDQIPGAVKWVPDADGIRMEIICANCGAHLGHVFIGEHYTPKDQRYCVNSLSMNFIPASVLAARDAAALQSADPNSQSAIINPQSQETAIFASGCFWGTQYYMKRAPGVISTTVGYTGGHIDHPTYEQVHTGRTGHAESVEVVFDPLKTSYEQLAKLFFETHDFTQINRQGPDIGTQYRSAIFYLNDQQKQIATRLVDTLRKAGYKVATQVTKAGTFWPAEDYHQDHYAKTGGTPYCHVFRPIPALEPAPAR